MEQVDDISATIPQVGSFNFLFVIILFVFYLYSLLLELDTNGSFPRGDLLNVLAFESNHRTLKLFFDQKKKNEVIIKI